MAGLTTHVLDTSIGKPAHNILIELFFLNNEVKNKILECTTNKDGRVDKPLLSDENFNLLSGFIQLFILLDNLYISLR